jgi:polyhydroxybutyrate depolymerase
MSSKADDVGFIRELIKWLKATRRIEPGAVFVAGMSDGGMMAHRLGCELSDEIAGIAPVAGLFMPAGCKPLRPVSVIMFNGTADKHVPYAGGAGSKAILNVRKRPVSEAVAFWVAHNRCSSTPMTEEAGALRRDTYPGSGGVEVVLCTIKGGGHAWPGDVKAGKVVGTGAPSMTISASDLILAFFRRHIRKT